MSTEGKESPVSQGFKFLGSILTRAGSEAQGRVIAHIREHTARHYASLANYHHDTAIPDEDKVKMYKYCINALKPGGEASYPLLGNVGNGAAKSEIESITTPEPVAEPLEESEEFMINEQPTRTKADIAIGEDDDAAIAKALLALRKPKVDEASVRRISADVTMKAVELFSKGLESQLNDRMGKLNRVIGEVHDRIKAVSDTVLTEEAVKQIITKANNNGAFPVDKVQELIDASVKKIDAASLIKPELDRVLTGTLKEFISKGPSALTTTSKPKDSEIKIEVPDMESPDLKHYKVSPAMASFAEAIYKRSRGRHETNLLITGPSGCGKTTFAQWLGAKYKMPVCIIHIANFRETRDLFGHKDYDGTAIVWKRSLLDKAFGLGNHIIVFDEINRAVDSIRNGLMPLLDHQQRTWLDEKGDWVVNAKGNIVIGTANIGIEFTGTSALDAALESRFKLREEVTFLKPNEEAGVLVSRTGIKRDDALKLAEVAETIRTKAVSHEATLTRTISTRQLCEAAEWYQTMGVSGLRYTLANHFSAEGGENSERTQVLQTIQLKFGSV